MRKYAAVVNNKVTAILDLSDEEFSQQMRQVDALVDIEDMAIQPEVGWCLVGNTFSPAETIQLSADELRAIQQKAQRVFGQKLTLKAMDSIGARNLQFAEQGTPINVAALANSLAPMKILLEGGALKTARSLIAASAVSLVAYGDIFTNIVTEIDNFLAERGY